MKTLSELFELVAVAVERNQQRSETWFFDYSGHVNKLSIRYHECGWKSGGESHRVIVDFYLTEEGIQGAYWFIKTNL
jgi:hypothetical protein